LGSPFLVAETTAMTEGKTWMRPGAQLTWAEARGLISTIWPGDEWMDHFRRHCQVSMRTVARWQEAGHVPATVSAMLNAFMRLRHHGLALPDA